MKALMGYLAVLTSADESDYRKQKVQERELLGGAWLAPFS